MVNPAFSLEKYSKERELEKNRKSSTEYETILVSVWQHVAFSRLQKVSGDNRWSSYKNNTETKSRLGVLLKSIFMEAISRENVCIDRFAKHSQIHTCKQIITIYIFCFYIYLL